MKIYRQGDPDPIELADVNVNESTIYSRQLMGQHIVDANWISASPINLKLGDYVIVGNEKLYLNRPVSFEKMNNFTYKYSGIFQGEIYGLYRRILRHLGKKLFTYFGDPEAHMLLLLENINSIDPGWTLNIDLPVTYEPQYISFDGVTCRVALTQIMEAFGLEFRLVQKEIIVRQDVGFESSYSFEYGRHKGLYVLHRDNADESHVVTHLYGYGGTQNIPSDYRGGLNELGFEYEGNPFIAANVGLYGVREGEVTFPEIFPRRTGSITAVIANNIVQDSTLDFDINAHLIGGVTAKIVFKSGALNGHEFEIEKGGYNHELRQITFIPKDEAGGAVIPDTGSFQPEAGDTYTLVGINMPETYKAAAEAELLAATQEAHMKKKSPEGIYALGIDEKYVMTNGIALECGMRVGVKDAPIGLDEQIRIFAISFPYVKPAKIVAQIADSIPLTNEEQYIKDVKQTKKDVVNVDRTRAEDMRESTWRFNQLREKIYDPDGYFEPINFKPASIETGMLSVGAKSQDFALNGVEIEPNYLGDANAIRISAGDLIHFQVQIEGLGYVWEMDANIIEGLVPATYYYVYARCNQSALTGTWMVSETPLGSESEAGFYRFWLGLLYPVKDGVRFFMFTKGMTFIVGDTITTGRITSFDGLNFFDVSNGTFNLGGCDSGLDWDITSPGALTIRGAVIADAVLADGGFIKNLKVNSLKTGENEEGKRMEILAYSDAEETVPAHNQKFYDDSGKMVLTVDTAVDSDLYGEPRAGIRVNTPDGARTAMITGNGLFSNAGKVQALPASSGLEYNGSVVGLLFDRNPVTKGISAAVMGIDGTGSDTPGASAAFGGYFNSLLAHGLHVGTESVSGNYTVSSRDVFISCYAEAVVKLPAGPKTGRIVFVRRNSKGDLWIDGNGVQILAPGLVNVVKMGSDSGRGNLIVCFYDGSYWTFNRFGM